MISNFIYTIFDYLSSTTKTAVTSISSAIVGSVNLSHINNINIAFQHTAYTIAIISGIIASVNGIDNFIRKHKNRKFINNKHEKQ